MSGPVFLLSTRLRANHKDLYPLLGLHMLSSYEPSSALQSSLLENYKTFMCVHLQIVANRSFFSKSETFQPNSLISSLC
jgi:hypothetical protein